MSTADGLLLRGAPVDRARAAIVLIHGRGASAESILPLAEEILVDEAAGSEALDGVALVAPRAPGGSQWYPFSFLAPIAQNEPHLSNALARLDETFQSLEAAGLPRRRVLLVGFSQGACLALEWLARRAGQSTGPFGGVAGLSGGLIGPPGTPRDYPGSLHATPVFLGCSDVDPHIPRQRVEETAQVLERMGASVTARLYRGMGHTVNEDEIEAMRTMWKAIKAETG